MEERIMSKQEVVKETIKILSSVELPMVLSSAISAIQGSIRNLKIVDQMFDAEDEMRRTKDENHNAE